LLLHAAEGEEVEDLVGYDEIKLTSCSVSLDEVEPTRLLEGPTATIPESASLSPLNMTVNWKEKNREKEEEEGVKIT